MTAGPDAAGCVQILMGTRNGAAFLGDQLASLAAQDHADWALHVADDGSTDATRDIVARFAARHPGRDIRLLDGPCRGSAANFLALAADPGVPPGPIAFADQDDVWLPHKLARALDRLAGLRAAAPGQPAAYASRTWLTDAALAGRRGSARHAPAPGFAATLVHNVLAGNTLVLDADAAALLRATVPAALAAGVAHHDWWVALAMTGAGASVLNDDLPGLLYRQHGTNALGAHRGLRGVVARLATVAGGGWAAWIDANLAALQACRAQLTPSACALLDDFAALRADPSPLARLTRLRRAGIRREGRGADLVLAALALAGRI